MFKKLIFCASDDEAEKDSTDANRKGVGPDCFEPHLHG